MNLKSKSYKEKIKENQEKIKFNKQLPYLVGNIAETIFLPVVGLVDPNKLKPGDLVGVNKDSYLILDTLPLEYDSRVKAMEVDEKPTEGDMILEMFIGDGAELVRDAFQLAKEKSQCIIFIDAIGTKHFDSDDRIKINSRKMNVHPDVNFEELGRSTDDFNGAQLGLSVRFG
ncbi:unnamed protein product [Linum tenue]|uniref:Uncharacterized protein n=1 Tax=Linum tenue TaxID=586396 RepID=A0AAV0J819_9ROSI|nr:unnamed protein product [Linum tenue]